MTEPLHRDRATDRWSAPGERVIIIGLLVIALLAVIGAVVVLGVHHDIDKAGLTAVLGTIAGGLGSAIVHKLSSRS